MRFLITLFSVVFLFSSAQAMYQADYTEKALGLDLKNYNEQNLITYNNSTNTLDESLIDQLIASFLDNNDTNVLDESLIDQLIASFPDTIESYRSNTPADLSFYEILVDTYRS